MGKKKSDQHHFGQDVSVKHPEKALRPDGYRGSCRPLSEAMSGVEPGEPGEYRDLPKVGAASGENASVIISAALLDAGHPRKSFHPARSSFGT